MKKCFVLLLFAFTAAAFAQEEDPEMARLTGKRRGVSHLRVNPYNKGRSML